MVDVLIIGGGGAGLTAALAAREAGAAVAVIGKSYPTRSQTCMAQGGINAALGHAGEDSVEAHIADTMKSSQGLADEAAVTTLCSEGIDALRWLDAIGVPFSRTEASNIAQRRLGGASAARACYAQDYSGLKILHTLYDQCNRAGISFYNERLLLDIVVESGRAKGVEVLNIRSGEVEIHAARSVILATGGYSRLYGRYSTNAVGSTGDGHAARGAGGHLLNGKGERFIDELLPRDQVARAIHEQIVSGETVRLDIRHLGEAFIDEELPQERKLAKRYEGVDPVSDPVPIKPVAHYTMGGIEVGVDSQTAVAGLYAAGECANHRVHGANRLGGNSLLELIVFGKQAGRNAAALAAKSTEMAAPSGTVEPVKAQSGFSAAPEIDFYEQRDALAALFYEKVGLIRDASGLTEACEVVKTMKAQLPKMGVKDAAKRYNTNRTDFLEFVNMLTVAETVAEGALRRKESRGAHYRSDFAEPVEAFAAHSLSCIKGEELCFDFE
ncbi:MAG: FAD-dependent oxidoreductase [Campylobacterales bacterium]